MNCQENCPYVMPCGDCFACSQYPNCEDKPNNAMCKKCKKCFNNEKDEEHDSSVGGYYIDVFMNPHKQTQKFGVKYKYIR